MKVVVTSKMNRINMFDFLIRHTFFSFWGYIGLLVSICAFGAAIYTWGRLELQTSILLIITGCLFVVVEPIMLFVRAGKMVSEGGEYHVPITYTLSSAGIELARNGNTADYKWGDITKVITTKYAVVLYSGKFLTFLLTKEGIGNQFDDMETLIQKYAQARYIKIRK